MERRQSQCGFLPPSHPLHLLQFSHSSKQDDQICLFSDPHRSFSMQSYPTRALDRRLQVDWARDPREGPRILMSLRYRVLAFYFFHGLFPSAWCLLSLLLLCLPLHLHGGKSPLKDLIEAQRSCLHRSPTSKLPSSEFARHLGKGYKKRTNYGKKNKRENKKEKRMEEISQDERKKIREEERRKIMKEMKREKHASYSSHNSCKSLSEELRDYYEGRHRSHLRPHSHRREKERKPQEANINLPYFHGKDNIEANLVWDIRVEQQLKKKSTSKSYGSHSYPKKYQGQGILGVTPSKPKDDKGKTIEKQAPKAKDTLLLNALPQKTMIMRGQDIYSSQDRATTSPSSSEEIYPQEEGQPLVVKEKCKEVSVSSKRQPPYFLFCKNTLASIATPLGLEFIPQVKKLLDEGLVRKSFNPCALLVPKIGIIRHQVPKIGGMMQSYPARALDRRLQVDWARDPREGRRVLISLKADFESIG
ncbi:hypothetical protein HKD37_02G004807 [Glycine soja]